MMSHCCWKSGMQDWTRRVVWLWISHMFQTKMSHLKVWLGLEDPFQGLHSLTWCWPEFLTDFCQETPVPHHRDFSIERQACMSKSKRENKVEATMSFDLSSGVIYRHSCCYLFVTKINPTAIWEGTIQWLKYQGVGLAGAICKAEHSIVHTHAFPFIFYF